MNKNNAITQVADKLDEFPFANRQIKSRLGYDVEVFTSNGDFKSIIIVPDDTTEFIYLKAAKLNHLCIELKDIVRSYVKYILERYQQGTLRERFKFLTRFACGINSGLDVEGVLASLSLENFSDKKTRLISSAKEFLRFLILHEYEGVSFATYEEFTNLRGYTDKSNGYAALFLMDEENGPFTREEISVLLAEVQNEKHSLFLRLLLDLCLSFGLRPIQIALLKRGDYVKDNKTGLRYLNVPRVKNFSRYRRSQFSARILNERTANLIERCIESTDFELSNIDSKDLPIFISARTFKLELNLNGSKYWRGEARLSSEYYDSNEKQSYVYHKRASYLTHTLAYAEINFPLSPRTGKKFNLHPYRFRYTVGTQAVMSGCTPEEVADLLDHSTTQCVKHYFRFTHEMWEILEQATQRRIEQKHFTAAWMREVDLKGNIYARVIYESRCFTAIGKCATESACFEEPAVACYSCRKFCPSKSTSAHINALENLIQRKDKLLLVSAVNVVSVFDQSIAGCHAAIAYSEGKHVTFINVKEL